MSQYPGGPTSYGAVNEFGTPLGQPAKTSGLAIAALVCSLIFCCPVTTLLGVLLGLVSFVSIGSNPARKGRGLALAAIVIGLLLTIGWGFFIYNGYRGYEMVRQAPVKTLQKGQAGDIAGFKADFGAAAAQVSDAEAQAFIDSVRSRCGAVQGAGLDWQAFQTASTGRGAGPMQLFYVLTFDQGTRDAEITFDPQKQQTDDQIIFDKLIIHDAAGDLEFPPPPPTPSDAQPADEATEDAGSPP